jgi:hypothetical protein
MAEMGNLPLWNYQNTVGGANPTKPPPEHLKTKKQLGELGLSLSETFRRYRNPKIQRVPLRFD